MLSIIRHIYDKIFSQSVDECTLAILEYKSYVKWYVAYGGDMNDFCDYDYNFRFYKKENGLNYYQNRLKK